MARQPRKSNGLFSTGTQLSNHLVSFPILSFFREEIHRNNDRSDFQTTDRTTCDISKIILLTTSRINLCPRNRTVLEQTSNRSMVISIIGYFTLEYFWKYFFRDCFFDRYLRPIRTFSPTNLCKFFLPSVYSIF